MARCFVIQPFDKGLFDKRYKDVFKSAIKDAGLEPYRVDQDPGVSIPIKDIENGIRDSEICFAEITTNNPNVWFELGFAIAIPKEVVLVCSAKRKGHFPFDVQHRNIIKYNTATREDISYLRSRIIKRIKAVLKKHESISPISPIFPIAKFCGRWEGWYCETDEKKWYPTVHEIKLDGNEITAIAYGRRNQSESICAYVEKHKQGRIRLIWTYDSKTIADSYRNIPNHIGTHIADFRTTRYGGKVMEGKYFNDREQIKNRIGSGGTFICKWVSSDLKNSLSFDKNRWPLNKPLSIRSISRGR